MVKNFLIAGAALCVYAVPVQAQPAENSAMAVMEMRFQQLEKEIRRLTGQIEEQNYEIRQLRESLSKQASDFTLRLRDIEQGRSGAGAPSVQAPRSLSSQGQARDVEPESADLLRQPPVKPTAPQDSPGSTQQLGTLSQSQETGVVSAASGDAAQAYDFAYSFIKARDFDRAEREFAQFMSTYPEHALVANAKYWYGETYYVRGQYDKAARIFAEGYKMYPKGGKAASNLLKLGMSLVGMEKPNDACIAFKQLQKEYARSSIPVLKRAENEMKKINCQ